MKKTLILAAILIVPSVAYLLIRTGHNHFKKLEIFGPKEPIQKVVDGKNVTDTAYHVIGNFNLLSSDSTAVSETVTRGKIYVADFFFTTCKTICPKMSDELMAVQYKYKQDSDVMILSHTVDPENDSPSVLKAYAKAHNAIPGKWIFITGDKKELYDLARNDYFITASKGDGGADDFVHSEQLVLVDKEKRIRGFYDGTDNNDVKRLIDEIRVLQLEYADPHHE